MDALITSFMVYIAAVSGSFSEELKYDSSMEAPKFHPSVSFVSYEQLSLMKYNRKPSPNESTRVEAGYLYGGQIFLPSDWDIDDLGDQSKLLHELVHYMQEMNYLDYECEGDRERLAYYIQEKWLKDNHNLTIHEAIGLNLLVQVGAMYCPPPATWAKPWEGGA